eukprot:4852841-Prymnesium_polylepis.1
MDYQRAQESSLYQVRCSPDTSAYTADRTQQSIHIRQVATDTLSSHLKYHSINAGLSPQQLDPHSE